LRATLKRGTIQVQLSIRRQHQPSDFVIDQVALGSYHQQLRQAQANLGLNDPIPLSALLDLPGVVPETDLIRSEASEIWPTIEPVVSAALEKLQAMRREEGRAMQLDLETHQKEIAQRLELIRRRAPSIVNNYRDRLKERLQTLLNEQGITIEPHTLIREVAIFADRTDITEEITRLGSHLEQFLEVFKEPESPGRKLEFLAQEMLRETNTIGSKANDVQIAHEVVNIKGTIEKIKELIQNIE
jgi:uncharacterized protein (TIGR00255 family)